MTILFCLQQVVSKALIWQKPNSPQLLDSPPIGTLPVTRKPLFGVLFIC